jgi:hypothetical protein
MGRFIEGADRTSPAFCHRERRGRQLSELPPIEVKRGFRRTACLDGRRVWLAEANSLTHIAFFPWRLHLFVVQVRIVV